MEQRKIPKAKIFLTSSGRSLTLAERLREKLKTDFCEATLWSEKVRDQTSASVIEMLDRATLHYDFAVFLLIQDDIIIGKGLDAGMRNSHDNCVFEAGLFAAALGRDRCYLIHSINQEDLPSDLLGMISIPFNEPPDLMDSQACSQAISEAATVLLHSIQRERDAGSAPHAVRFLSIEEIFHRERLSCEGGNLLEGGNVVVCDTQPIAGVELTLQVRNNMDRGISYHYFLHFTDDSVEKVCQSLQVMLMAGVGGAKKAGDFSSRINTILKKKNRVLDDLRDMCRKHNLRVTFLNHEPQTCYRIHNASNNALAQLYARHPKLGFMLWAEGRSAVLLWDYLPEYLDDSNPDRIFIPLKHFALEGDNQKRFFRSLESSLSRYFPEIDSEIKKICIGEYH